MGSIFTFLRHLSSEDASDVIAVARSIAAVQKIPNADVPQNLRDAQWTGFVTRSQTKINTSLVDSCVAIISDGIVLLKKVGFDVDVSGVAVDDPVKEHIPEEWRTCWSKACGRKAELKGIVEQI